MFDNTPEEELASLVGLSADDIGHTTLEHETWQLQAVADAAQIVRERCGRTWVFVTIEPDGATIWRCPETSVIATVSSNGKTEIDTQAGE